MNVKRQIEAGQLAFPAPRLAVSAALDAALVPAGAAEKGAHPPCGGGAGASGGADLRVRTTRAGRGWPAVRDTWITGCQGANPGERANHARHAAGIRTFNQGVEPSANRTFERRITGPVNSRVRITQRGEEVPVPGESSWGRLVARMDMMFLISNMEVRNG